MSIETTHESVTIEEVAAASGVSRSTVSRVVNGSTAVSPAALEAVQRAIAELNYVPNRAARSLASKQTHAIALVVPEDTSRFFGDPFFAPIVSGINAYLSKSDYVLNLFIASDDPGDKTTDYLRSGAVDGAIIVSHHTSDTFIDRIASAVPVVYGGRPLREREGDYYVDVDNVRGGQDATAYLIARGHRRIATIAGPLTMPAGVDRLHGYRQALAEAGLRGGRSRTATSRRRAGPTRCGASSIAAAIRPTRSSSRATSWPGARSPCSPRRAAGAGGCRDHRLRRLAGRDIRHTAADDDAPAVLRPGREDGEHTRRVARRPTTRSTSRSSTPSS